MAFNLKNRHLLSLLNHSPEEIRFLLNLSKDLKNAKYTGTEVPRLKGKNIALIFEKTSTRTRCAFEVAAFDQGAHVTYLDPQGSQIGHKESIADTARVLGRMYDAIEYRGSKHSIVETLAKYAGVPVFNGLTDDFHPTQMLADVLTMMEHCSKPIDQISFTYMGDARNNVGNSLLVVAAKLGMHIKIGAPKSLWPDAFLIEKCQVFANQTGAKLEFFEDAHESVRDVDFIYTDVWVSMGEEKKVWDERIKLLLPYQVNSALMKAANNPKVKFMHCLPAFHDTNTTVGKALVEAHPELKEGVEVTHQVFESQASIVFDQAENRMHTIKAVMVASLA